MGCASSKGETPEPVLTGSIDADGTKASGESTTEPAPASIEAVKLDVGAPAPASADAPAPASADESAPSDIDAQPELIRRRSESMPLPQNRAPIDTKPKATLEDFDIGRLLGRGAFGKVHLAVRKGSGEKYAMKTLNKHMLVQAKQVSGALTEKEVLRQRGHPFIVRLYHSFQDANSLHMILDYCPGGDLYDRIEEEGSVSLERARLYGAEITLGLGHLHDELKVIYRDIKPENVLIDARGHAMLTDFGLAVRAASRKAFCGSTEYIAPEVARLRSERDGEHDKAVDWWGLGVLLYELLVGSTPFCHDSHDEVLRRVLEAPITMPEGMDEGVSSLILQLMQREPTERLGSGDRGTTSVMAHPFWSPLSFSEVRTRATKPEWSPPDPEASTAEVESKAAQPPADADGDGDGEEPDDEISGSSSEEDESDEWHQMAPGAASDPKVEELFRGFTFHRGSSFMPNSLSGKMTRSTSLLKKRSGSGVAGFSRTSSIKEEA
jgi:serine/threonine protein kinase